MNHGYNTDVRRQPTTVQQHSIVRERNCHTCEASYIGTETRPFAKQLSIVTFVAVEWLSLATC